METDLIRDSFFILAVIVLGVIFSLSTLKQEKYQQKFQISLTPTSPSPPYFSKIDIPMPQGVKSAHSATIVHLDNGNLLTAFFAGSREGAKDVKIYGSIYETKNKTWGRPFVLLDRNELSKKSKQYIKKLGNPVLYADKQRIYLFVVGVSIGGWATSKIYQLYTDNFFNSKGFVYKQNLHLSPFFNLSNLVRTQPLTFTHEGEYSGFYLPIYNELANKYPLIVRFDSEGNMTKIIKPNNLHRQLQPSLVELSDTKCLAVFRNHGVYKNTMFSQICSDGGLEWSKPFKTNIKNFNNSAVLIRFNNKIYLIHNTHNADLARGRLTLSMMNSPKEFLKVLDLDSTDVQNGEVSYPSAISDGENIDIVYTHDRKNIRHIRLNRAYLGDKY